MKTLINLIMTASLFWGQFLIPSNFHTAQAEPASTDTPTPTATEVPTETLPTTDTPTSPAETPTASETPTPSQTAEPTQTPSLQDTASATPSGTPTETSTPTGVSLTLKSEPDFISLAGKITIFWSIEGIRVEEHKLTLKITLPAGFAPAEDFKDLTEAQNDWLAFEIKDTEGKIRLQVEGVEKDVLIEAVLLEGEKLLASTSMIIPCRKTREEYTLDAKGGEIRTSDGKIKLILPPNALDSETIIEIGTPDEETLPAYPLNAPFELKAYEKESRAEKHEFNDEIEIEVNYAEFGIPEEYEDHIFLYWYNPEIPGWEALPSAVDVKTKTLRAVTTHFSVFDVGVNQWQASHLPNVDAYQVANFTGAGTYSLPIEVPAGPGGLQPHLTLTYNSQVVDQAATEMQASWVGMGWSLDTGYIEKDTRGTTTAADDAYYLNMGGVSQRLIKVV